MSHESMKALERIVTICERSANLSMRQIRIFDIALEGIGYLACQRAEIIEKWQRPHIEKMRARQSKREDATTLILQD